MVNEPTSAVPDSSRASPVTPLPCSRPSRERAEGVHGQRPVRERPHRSAASPHGRAKTDPTATAPAPHKQPATKFDSTTAPHPAPPPATRTALPRGAAATQTGRDARPGRRSRPEPRVRRARARAPRAAARTTSSAPRTGPCRGRGTTYGESPRPLRRVSHDERQQRPVPAMFIVRHPRPEVARRRPGPIQRNPRQLRPLHRR